jgi:hypothetical protein
MHHRVLSGLKLIAAPIAIAGLLSGFTVLTAQESGTQTTTKTKVTIKDGKDVKVTGCVARAETGALILKGVADKKHGALPDYLLVLNDDKEQDLAKEVGHQVEISGKAANQGEGKVKFEVEEKTKQKDGDEHKTERSSQVSGDDLKLPLLGVRSYKMIAAACPGTE